MKQKNWQISVALISVILGILLAVQFKSQQSINAATPTRRVEELAVMLQKVKEDRLAMAQKVAKQKQQLASGAGKISDYETEAYLQLKAEAGLMDMIGQGIVVTLNENNTQTPNNLNAVQDEDLLRTVNELKAAGAEAIAINDQRIVAISEIRWASANILVNNVSISSPYEIRAIGDQKRLESALKLENGIVDTLSVWGIKIKISSQANLEIPAYRSHTNFKQAVIVEKD